LDRPFPTDFTRQVLGVDPGDAIVRRWTDATEPQFYAESWGAEGGRGEHAWSKTGSRLFVRTASLKALLGPLIETSSFSSNCRSIIKENRTTSPATLAPSRIARSS